MQKTIQSGARRIHHPFLADADYKYRKRTRRMCCADASGVKKNIYAAFSCQIGPSRRTEALFFLLIRNGASSYLNF